MRRGVSLLAGQHGRFRKVDIHPRILRRAQSLPRRVIRPSYLDPGFLARGELFLPVIHNFRLIEFPVIERSVYSSMLLRDVRTRDYWNREA